MPRMQILMRQKLWRHFNVLEQIPDLSLFASEEGAITCFLKLPVKWFQWSGRQPCLDCVPPVGYLQMLSRQKYFLEFSAFKYCEQCQTK